MPDTRPVLSRHARVVDDLRAATPDGPLPDAPTRFIASWLGPALAHASPDLRRRMVDHHGEAVPRAWAERFHGAPPSVLDVLRADLRQLSLPRLRGALTALFDGLERHGIDPEGVWGVDSPTALLDLCPRIVDLHPGTFFGATMPMIALGPNSVAELARCLDAGVPPEVVLDVRLAGQVMHELSHGPNRGWSGGPGSYLLAEASGTIVSLGCRAAHVLAETPGEAVVGLRNALVLGHALVDELGEAAVWRLAMCATSPTDELGAVAGHALVAMDWQEWLPRDSPSFVPDNRRALDAAKLLWIARHEPERIPALAVLGALDAVGPADVIGLSNLLDAARDLPWPSLGAWAAPVEARHLLGVDLAVRSMFQVERLQPDLQVCPADPPRGELVLDVADCRLSSAPRLDHAYGEAASWCLAPPLCRELYRRGLRRLVITGCASGRVHPIADRIRALATGGHLPASMATDVALVAPRGQPAHTVVPTVPPQAQLHHADAVVTLGSCFAEHIGQRLAGCLFDVCDNPFGKLYDPMSVARAMAWIGADEPLPAGLLFHAHDQWHSPWHHTAWSRPDAVVMRAGVDHALTVAREARRRPGTWLLTWGTAWVFEDVGSGEIVANCHGLEPERFRRRLLTPGEIVERYREALGELRHVQPAARVVLTVSPIRHLADGAVANQRSKATLHLAAQTLVESEPGLTYFPAYEIVLDELRDYRWYDADRVHVAVETAELVFERFLQVMVAPSSRAHAREQRAVLAGLVTMPRDPWRRREVLAGLLDRLDQLDPAPSLPRPTSLVLGIHTQMEALGPPTAPSPSVEPIPAPPERPRPAPAPAVPVADQLSAFRAALLPGVFVAFDDLAPWAAAVGASLPHVPDDATPAAHAAYRSAVEALLDKGEELEDPAAVLPPLVEPLLARVLRTAHTSGDEGDVVDAVLGWLLAGVPTGCVVAEDATLARLGLEERAQLRERLAEELERRRRAGRHPHQSLVALSGRLELLS